MPLSRLRSIAALLTAVVLLASSPIAAGQAASTQPITRTVYATVTDQNEVPAMDVRTDEFEVRYAGKLQEIKRVQLAVAPLRVALIVADRGTGMFQLGALRFLEGLLGRGVFSITGVLTQPIRLLDYAGDVDAIRAGLIQLQRRGGANAVGAQVVEAIHDATKEVARAGHRPVIVVLRAGGEAATPVRAETVRESLRQSGAILYAISRAGTQSVGGGGNPTEAPTAAAVSHAAANSEIMEGQLTLGMILGEGSNDSGGRHIQAISTSIVSVMQQIARELVHQYEITYVMTEAGRPSDRLSVTVKRPGINVAAATRVPD